VTNQKTVLPTFLQNMKDRSSYTKQKERLVEATQSTEIWGQNVPVEAKTPIFNRYSLVAPQQ